MIIFFVILFALCAWRMKYQKDGYYNDYINPSQTAAIRGIFACIIFLSHLRDYMTLSGPGANSYSWLLYQIGQCMVAAFFFYSGYGIMFSYRIKENYEKGFLKKRLFITWLHFAVAVCMYWILNCILGNSYPLKRILLSFTGWDDIGNSNWFMFVTFAFYLIIWISFKIIKKVLPNSGSVTRSYGIVALAFVGTSILFVFLHMSKGSWWYDTVFTFAAGGLYCLLKDKIDKFVMCRKHYLISGVFVIAMYVIFREGGSALLYNVCAIFFVLAITWFTMKVKINNPFIDWMGKYSFYIYIYMRIPMIILQNLGLFANNNYLFTIVSFILTVSLAYIMSCVQKKIDRIFV